MIVNYPFINSNTYQLVLTSINHFNHYYIPAVDHCSLLCTIITRIIMTMNIY